MKLGEKRERKRNQIMGPKRARGPLRSVLKNHGIDKSVREHRILNDWESIVGPRLAERTLPDSLDKGVLWVRVSSSSWLHQLSFLKEDLVASCNRACGADLVKDIRFHLGRTRHKGKDALAAAAAIRRPPARQRPLPPPATGAHLDEIRAQAAHIEDPELREAIIEARRKLAL